MTDSPITMYITTARSEDLVRVGNGWVLVLDGVTPTQDRDNRCQHNVRWWVDTLGDQLAQRLDGPTLIDLHRIVALSITSAANSHIDTCDVTDPDHPAAMVAILRLRGDWLDYYVLGDCTILVETTDKGIVSRVTDSRPNSLGLYPDVGRRNVPGGFWVAAALPGAARYGLYGTWPVAQINRAVMCSDSGMRLVDRCGHKLRTFFHRAHEQGPAVLLIETLNVERSETLDQDAQHGGKAFGDLTLVAVLLKRQPHSD